MHLLTKYFGQINLNKDEKLNKLFIVFLSISLTSCVDDTALSDQFDDST